MSKYIINNLFTFPSRDYRSHNSNNSNGNGNNSTAMSSSNRDRDRRYSSEEDSYDSDESDDSQYRRNHVRTSNEALNQIIIFGLKKHITEADVSAIQQGSAWFSLNLFLCSTDHGRINPSEYGAIFHTPYSQTSYRWVTISKQLVLD